MDIELSDVVLKLREKMQFRQLKQTVVEASYLDSEMS